MKTVVSCAFGLSVLLVAGCDTTSSVPSDSSSPYGSYVPYYNPDEAYNSAIQDSQVYSNYLNNHYNAVNGANTPNCGGRVVSAYSVCPQ